MKFKILACMALVGMISLQGCSHKSHPEGKPLPKLSYEHINPLSIHGGSVRIQQSFQPTAHNRDIEAQFPFTLLRCFALMPVNALCKIGHLKGLSLILKMHL